MSRPRVGSWWPKEARREGGSAKGLPSSSGEHLLTGPFQVPLLLPTGWLHSNFRVSLAWCHLPRQQGPAGAATSFILSLGHSPRALWAAGPFMWSCATSCHR